MTHEWLKIIMVNIILMIAYIMIIRCLWQDQLNFEIGFSRIMDDQKGAFSNHLFLLRTVVEITVVDVIK